MRGFLRWILAVVVVAAAELATRAAIPIVDGYTASFFVIAVLLCAWRGGFWIGTFATVASTLFIVARFATTPLRGEIDGGELMRLAMFAGSALVINVVCAQLRRAAVRERRNATALADREAVLRRETSVRERTEALLDEERARLAGVIGSAMDAIITTDEDQRIVLFNRSAEQLFGVPHEQAIGSDLGRFIPALQPGEQPGTASVVLARRADGSEFPAEAAISEVTTRGRRWCTVIMRDVTGRQRQELEREGLIAELQAASEAKSRFLATMSHELRTPLNAILGYAELMEMGVVGPVSADQRDYLQRISSSGTHLRRMIDEVLDLAKVEAGQMAVRRETADLVSAVEASVALVRPLAAERSLRLESRMDCDGALQYLGDEERVRQILLNLLSNAVKFTPPGGHITITCGERRTARGDSVYVEVADTGPGIPEHQQSLIFEPFVQAADGTNAYTRTAGGTGLGLAISRKLARLMGGEIELRSRPGEGSAFTLRLPASVTPTAPVVTAADDAFSQSALGRRLAERVPEIIARFTKRVREDPYLRVAHEAESPDLEDHLGTFLADFAQHLVILDTPNLEDRAGMIRDGSLLQELMARRHGAQRRRLGWDERALRREFAILRDEILASLEEAGEHPDAHLDQVALVRAFLREAASTSFEGFRAGAPRRDREVRRVAEQEGMRGRDDEGHPRPRAGGLRPSVEQ